MQIFTISNTFEHFVTRASVFPDNFCQFPGKLKKKIDPDMDPLNEPKKSALDLCQNVFRLKQTMLLSIMSILTGGSQISLYKSFHISSC